MKDKDEDRFAQIADRAEEIRDSVKSQIAQAINDMKLTRLERAAFVQCCTFGIDFEATRAHFAMEREQELAAGVSDKPTRYAVICPNHHRVFLTPEQYNAEMSNPDARWTCPKCGAVAEFDDANYEREDDNADNG